MKKTFVYALALTAIVACGKKTENNQTDMPQEPATEQAKTTAEETEPAAQEASVSFAHPQLSQKSWPVKGGVGVANFTRALLPGYHSYYAESPDNVEQFFDDEISPAEIDEKNGYLKSFSEGDGSERIEVCYWKRSDGSILVAFVSDTHESDYEHHNLDRAIKTGTLTFFLYDKDAKQLNPIEAPVDIKLTTDQHLACQLPQKGKDITYTITNRYEWDDEWTESDKVLKFDGMTFSSK